MYRLANRLRNSRRKGQLTIAPLATYRDPMTRSAPAVAATSAGSCAGSCDRSASIWQITSAEPASAAWKPST